MWHIEYGNPSNKTRKFNEIHLQMPCFPCVFLWSSTEVRDTPVDALLLPSADAQSNPRYRAMLTDLRTRIGFSSSVACADWALPGQQVIPGNDGEHRKKPHGKTRELMG